MEKQGLGPSCVTSISILARLLKNKLKQSRSELETMIPMLKCSLLIDTCLTAVYLFLFLGGEELFLTCCSFIIETCVIEQLLNNHVLLNQ